MCIRDREQLDMNREDGSIPISNYVEKYQQRSAEFENMSLTDFFTKIYKRGAIYSTKKVHFILRVIPKIKYDPGVENIEHFYIY